SEYVAVEGRFIKLSFQQLESCCGGEFYLYEEIILEACVADVLTTMEFGWSALKPITQLADNFFAGNVVNVSLSFDQGTNQVS
ncbi:hypothetical protein J6590_076712, partial [Homalodisca vitripennis]